MKETKEFMKVDLLRKSSDFILNCSDKEFYISEIRLKAKMSMGAVNNIKKELVKQGLIVFIKKFGKEKYFKLTEKGEMLYKELVGITSSMGWKT